MKITIIIPCHNEEPNIENITRELFKHYRAYINEIVIVDDASDDNTYSVAAGLAEEFPSVKVIKRTPPCGVGRALRDGFTNVKKDSDYILMMDGDFIYNIKEISAIIKKGLEGYDGVYGSRFLAKRNIQGYPMLKFIANRGFSFLVRHLLRLPYADLTNNFKLIRKDVVDNINWHSVNFSINAETGLYPLLKGCRVVEVPVSWIQRSKGMGLSDFRILKVAHSYTWVLLKAIALRYAPGDWAYKKIFTDKKKKR